MNVNWEAVFFDCDGVILDSLDIKTKAFEKIFIPYGSEYAKKGVEYHLKNGGVSRFIKIQYFFKNLLQKEISDQKLAEVGDEFSNFVLEGVLKSSFIDGALETIEELKKLNIPAYVISGTPHDEINYIFNKRKLSHFFREIHGTPRKKDEIVTDILARNNFNENNCLFVGDAMTDYDAAMKTGIKFLGIVKSGQTSPFPKGTAVSSNFSHKSIKSIIQKHG
ncbi:Phosphoglycolate phosphatase-like HAD superfamily hydrolase [Candidatus Magnetomoraceae bacterium gMMP-15]